MVLDLDDPIAKREKREAESILGSTDDNLNIPSSNETQKDSKEEIKDILSVLDTVDKELKKKYKK